MHCSSTWACFCCEAGWDGLVSTHAILYVRRSKFSEQATVGEGRVGTEEKTFTDGWPCKMLLKGLDIAKNGIGLSRCLYRSVPGHVCW